MSINITELDVSLTLRNFSKEEKQAVVRLMELAIEETKAAMPARIEKLERVEKIARQISKLFSKTDIIDIDEQDFNVWSIVGDAEKNELESALRDIT